MHLRALLLLLVLMARPVHAQAPLFMTGSAKQPVQGRYFSAAHAGVYWERPDGYPEGDAWPLFLGRSGGPTSSAWPSYPGVEPALSPDARKELRRRLARGPLPPTLRITFQHDGYEKLTCEVPRDVLGPGRHVWPATGFVQMMPAAVQVTFHTTPPGARVHLQSDDGPFLGTAGQPATVLMPLLLGPEGRFVDRTLVFVLDGYLPRQQILRPSDLLEHGAFPIDGTVTLQAATGAVAMGDAFARYAAPVAIVLVVVAALAWRRRPPRGSGEERLEPPPRMLARWQVNERIGSGGSATVYRGCAVDDPEPVAIKILDEDTAAEEAERRRFEREVAISCRLSHSNIVRIIDWDAGEAGLYLVMELLEGPTVRAMVSQGPIPLGVFVRIFHGVLDAMRYAHGQGVVHRDIKPENVLTTAGGVPKIVDFGIARGGQFATVTTTGRTVGTLAYMPPERFVAAVTDEPRSDQYSLGVMAYEMLAGRRPWPDAALGEVLLGIPQAPPPDLTAIRPDVPHALAGVIARMMALEIDDRFATTEEAMRAFDASLATDTKR